MPSALAEREICAWLRGERVAPTDARLFGSIAIAEGLAPLVLHQGGAPSLPPDVESALREELHRQLGLAAIRETELRRVLDALAAAGADVLVVKGAHVAQAFYEHPALRPRYDADLFIRPRHRDSAVRVLESLGYERRPAITGDAVQGQAVFDIRGVPGAILDVHWRLASPIVAADLFDFDVLWKNAQPLPQLGPRARAPHVLDAIAIAAVHQVAHHAAEPRLAWLFDLHVMLRTLDRQATDAFADHVRARGMTAVCLAAIRAAERAFPTAAGAQLLRDLSPAADEPSAVLLNHRTPSSQAWMDIRALRTWRARAAYVAGHLFPPAAYMRLTYAPLSRAPLPWLYARRIFAGARRWVFHERGHQGD